MTSLDRLQLLHRIAQSQHRRMGTGAGIALICIGGALYDGIAFAAGWAVRPAEWLIALGDRLIAHSRAPP